MWLQFFLGEHILWMLVEQPKPPNYNNFWATIGDGTTQIDAAAQSTQLAQCPTVIGDAAAQSAQSQLMPPKVGERCLTAYKLAKNQAVLRLDSTAQPVRHCQDKAILSTPTQDQLCRCIGKLNESSNTLEQCTHDLLKVQDDDDNHNTNEEARALLSKIGAASNRCLEIFDTPTRQCAAATLIVQPTSPSRPAQFRANDSLKPKELSMGFTPDQFHNWMAQFTAYYNSSRMTDLSLPEQQAYLFTNIDDTICGCILAHINDHTPIFGDNGCILLIEEEFRRAYPLIKRRIAFFQCKEEPNQNLADYIATLNALGAEADLQRIQWMTNTCCS